ncbi:Bone morphogenetic protein 4 [Lamprotornis superbus]|uniref:Bone morphogenetic protein 4 n=1 Tax=Lamprotornis superbus TaxID=245042 RepID=A0A835TUY3_9PASS|nr:Bone morphogenetic protein 4 [Lamprotornis superbus]
MLGTVLLLLALAKAACPSPANVASRRAEALKKLLEVFGMEDPPAPPTHFKQPPQYMVDLFNTVANADGVTKNPDILEGNTVRSFLDKTHSEDMRFLFVLSSVAKNEKILTAELHLFRLWPRVTDGPKRHHFCQVSVYQVLEKDKPDTPGGKKLLAARLVSLQTSGWEVFAITPAVRDWTEDESSNQGLLVTVQGPGGSLLDSPPLQFASGRGHHESKKPMLVLFTDDGRRGASLPTAGFPGGSHTPGTTPLVPTSLSQGAYAVANGIECSFLTDLKPQAPSLPAKMPVPNLGRSRSARSLDRLRPCQRHPLSVDFEEIGWSGWIISPRGYNAFHCKGSCPFPLGENMRPTNHATVQSIINALKLSEGVSTPCCVPDKLYSINLLYFDDDENVVLKQYDDMVAASCGCH